MRRPLGLAESGEAALLGWGSAHNRGGVRQENIRLLHHGSGAGCHEAKTNSMKPEKTPLLSAFGDMSGSGIYRQRITDEKNQSIPFWLAFDKLVDEFDMNHEYFVHHLGDGFLCNLKTTGKNG